MLGDSDEDLLASHAPTSPIARADLASIDSESELRFEGSDAAHGSVAASLIGLESSLDELGLESVPRRLASSPDLLPMDDNAIDEDDDLFATPVAWRSPATSPNASFVAPTSQLRDEDDLLAFDDDGAGDADDEDMLDVDDDGPPPSEDDPLDFDDRQPACDVLTALRSLALDLIVDLSSSLCAKPSRPRKSRFDLERRPPVALQLGARSGGDVAGCAAGRLDRSDRSSKRVAFPSRSSGSDLGGRRLAQLLRIIELVCDNLERGSVMSKRDLYYKDVALFRKQVVVDAFIDDLCATLGFAAAKGLFTGSLRLRLHDGTTLDGHGSSAGLLIPPDCAIEHLQIDDALAFVLVIEKHAVFTSLASALAELEARFGSCVMLTGKGYPDVATRELLRRIADDWPDVPILALVDGDPHGIDIVATYALGSAAMAFDNDNLAVDRVELLGVCLDHLRELGVDESALLPLTDLDRRKALVLLKRDSPLPDQWRRELSIMLHRSRKAEIEAFATSAAGPDGVLDYVVACLDARLGYGG